MRRDIAEATRHYEKAVELVESDFHAWAMLSTCYQAAGNEGKLRQAARKMVSEAEKAVQQDPSNGAALGILAGGYAVLKEEDRAREWIERAMLIDPDNLNMRYNFACVLAIHLDDKEGALRLLKRTLSVAGEYQIRIAETDTDFDSIRDDPRFQKMIIDARIRLGIEDAGDRAEAINSVAANPAAS
jgi:adenylate cyclase